jgi:penicillin-binding protein 2
VAGKNGTAQVWRDGKKDNHTWFVAFAPYENPKIALAVLVQGAKSGGQVSAPIAAKIIEEILALDKGYDPGVKARDPAVGNFKFVESVNFKDSDVLAQSAAQDEETSETAADAVDVRKKVTKAMVSLKSVNFVVIVSKISRSRAPVGMIPRHFLVSSVSPALLTARESF